MEKTKSEFEKLSKQHESYKEQSNKLSKILKIVVAGVTVVAVAALVGDGILGNFVSKKNLQISELENNLAIAESKVVEPAEVESLFTMQPMNTSVEAESDVTL